MPETSNKLTTAPQLIYLVDDEEALLDLAEMALTEDGYALKKFHDPRAALEAFANEPLKPSLLLTDYAMGSMSGIELSTKCKSVHPELKIILVSGTAGPEIIEKSPVAVDEFIGKPYEPQFLTRAVRALLKPEPPPS